MYRRRFGGRKGIRSFKTASKLSGDFLLRSGKRSNTYFDKYRFEADPALLRKIAEEVSSARSAGSLNRQISPITQLDVRPERNSPPVDATGRRKTTFNQSSSVG